jgi:hypothetical protein
MPRSHVAKSGAHESLRKSSSRCTDGAPAAATARGESLDQTRSRRMGTRRCRDESLDGTTGRGKGDASTDRGCAFVKQGHGGRASTGRGRAAAAAPWSSWR